MSKIVGSPKQNVAREILLVVQNGVTEIKKILVKDIGDRVDDKEITKKINKFISDTVKRVPVEELKDNVKRSLVSATKKWYYEYKTSLEILTRNISNQLGVDLLGLPTATLEVEMRKYIEIAPQVATPIIEDYRGKVKLAMRAFAADPAKSTVLKNGKAHTTSLRNRAEMTVRYMANLEDVERLKGDGVKLVWTSSHPNSSARCATYQGKLYSLDGSSGTVEGHRYTPLAEALKGPLGDGNGIINGYNCRHRLVEYRSGSVAPIEYSDAEIKKEYAIDARQRNYENQIRQLKTEEALFRESGDVVEARKLKAKWQRLTRNYESFSTKNLRAFYRWRTMI